MQTDTFSKAKEIDALYVLNKIVELVWRYTDGTPSVKLRSDKWSDDGQGELHAHEIGHPEKRVIFGLPALKTLVDRGMIDIRALERDVCPSCNGSGRAYRALGSHAALKQDCPYCRGSGEVSS